MIQAFATGSHKNVAIMVVVLQFVIGIGFVVAAALLLCKSRDSMAYRLAIVSIPTMLAIQCFVTIARDVQSISLLQWLLNRMKKKIPDILL